MNQKKEFVKNDVINNNDKIFEYDETRNASRLRERNENNERMFRKLNNEIERNDQKIEKSDRENEKHD